MATTIGEAKIVVRLEMPPGSSVPGGQPGTSVPGAPGQPGAPGAPGQPGGGYTVPGQAPPGGGRRRPRAPDGPGGDGDGDDDAFSVYDAGRDLVNAARRGGLYGTALTTAAAAASAVPFAGPVVAAGIQAAEFVREYGPAVGRAVEESLEQGSAARAIVKKVVDDAVGPIAQALNDVKVNLDAITSAYQATTTLAQFQTQIGDDGEFDLEGLGTFFDVQRRADAFLARPAVAAQMRARTRVGRAVGKQVQPYMTEFFRIATAGFSGR